MEIENLKVTKRVKLFLIRLPLLVVLVILVLTLMEVIPSAIWLIISAGIFFISLFTVLIGRFQYVKISVGAHEVLIRHYHLFPLISHYEELLVQKSDNPEFVIKYGFFGLIPILKIYVHTSQGKAVYPPIPLSLISKKDKNLLQSELGL